MTVRHPITLIAAGLLFLWLSIAVKKDGTIGFDAPVREAVTSCASPLATAAMRVLTRLGWDLLAIPLMALAAWRLAKSGRRREAYMLACMVIGIDILANLLKLVFARPRPEALFGYPLPSTSSFPSGHAALSLALYGTLAFLQDRVAIQIAGVVLVLLVGLSRIYLGVHYPSDVAAGYALSVVWVTAVRWGFERSR